ncbi:MAG: hypothetical protein HN576_05650 [Bacteriovoracaceae bacterium]|jgi:hypothetical protein|nr:hypothetical protein [Bacteriovoracaceae bacterium]
MKIFKLTISAFFLAFTFSNQATAAGLIVDLNVNYQTDNDNVQTYKYGTTIAQAFLGASITKSGKLFFGQNVCSFSRTYTTAGVSYSFSTLELGPRISYYFDGAKTWLFTAIWNPFAEGTRTDNSVVDEIKGSSMEFGLGYQIKLSKKVSLGVMMTYHALSITKVVDAAKAETTVSSTYTSIYPMLSLSMRF